MRSSRIIAAVLAVLTAAACSGCGTTDITSDGDTKPVVSVIPSTENGSTAIQTSAAVSASAAAVSSTAGSVTQAAEQSAAVTAAQQITQTSQIINSTINNGGNQDGDRPSAPAVTIATNPPSPPAVTQKTDAPVQTQQTAAPTTAAVTESAAVQTTAAVTTAAPKEVAALPGIDADLVARVSKMSLHEKVSQMMMASASDAATAKTAIQSGVGAMALFAKAFSGKTKKQVQEMTASFQKAAKIPILISIDEEGGTVNRVSTNPNLRASKFLSPSALYKNGGFELVVSDTEEKADLLLSLGVNSNLGPVCDVALSSSDYIFNRTFSLDHNMTAQYVEKVVTVMKEKHLASTLKHFPGYGGSRDTHKNMATDNRDYSAFENGDFLPFQAGIAAGADSVMVSHNIVTCMDKNYPASLSPNVHKILRETLGFTGVIVTDDLGMNAITQFTNGKNPAVAAVLAGNDFLCYADYQNSVPAIEKAVEKGEISEEQINNSVQRILQWKRNIGLI